MQNFALFLHENNELEENNFLKLMVESQNIKVKNQQQKGWMT